MDKAVAKQSADWLSLVAWADANRKRLIITAAVVLAAGAIVGMTVWHKKARETAANEAISKLVSPTSLTAATAADAEGFLKVANEYGETQAGTRALLVAGGMLFDAGKFKEAQEQFERFLREHSDSPMANQASVGVAASLEAQGKTAEAASRYEDIATRHATDSTTPQVKSALARLYVALNKPEQALRQYDDLVMNRNNDSWTSEAMLQREDLLEKYPNLRKPVAPPAPLAPMLSPTTAPATTNQPPTAPPTTSPPVLLEPVKK